MENSNTTPLWRTLGLTDLEYEQIVSGLSREPNFTELAMFSVMWSEHCAYKNSKPLLKMMPSKGQRVIQGPGENAGVLDIGDGLALVMKIESHNHPSAVEPYQGAATGVGGIVRDIFAMGARPVVLMDSLRFGSLGEGRTNYLFEQVVAGISDYGNCIGVPTVGGEIYFQDCYQKSPLVNALCAGIVEQDKMQTGKASGVGSPVLIVGATTGRDGIGGASFASQELGEDAEEKLPSVQVGDPFMEKLLIEACLEAYETGFVVAVQDMGAAGITSSASEMAARGGVGMELNLDCVPLRAEGMAAHEILISESQERMLLVVEKGKEDQIKQIMEKWGLHTAIMGRVTDDGWLRVCYHGEVVAQLPAQLLAEGAPQYIREGIPSEHLKDIQDLDVTALQPPADLECTLLELLKSPNIASKAWVFEQYDHMVRTDTVIKPGMDAAVVRIKGKKQALAFTTDCNSTYCYLDPYEGAKAAVAEAARNLSMVSAEPIGITDCLNFGNPEDPAVYWQMQRCIEGIRDACQVLNIPVISGNVSLYNETELGPIYPTPVIGCAGLVDDVSRLCTMGFKDDGDLVLVLGEDKGELGGSEYLQMQYGLARGKPPVIDLEREKALQELVRELIRAGLLKSAHDISEGGLAIALVECALCGERGVEVDLTTSQRPDIALFSESQGRAVVSISSNNLDAVLTAAEKYGVPATVLGTVGGESLLIRVNGEEVADVPLSQCADHHRWGLEWSMKGL